MIRKQIYLTEVEQQHLHILAKEEGRSQSELIREAIDTLIGSHLTLKQDKLSALQSAKGVWANRTNLPDFSKLRAEFDRKKKGDHEND